MNHLKYVHYITLLHTQYCQIHKYLQYLYLGNTQFLNIFLMFPQNHALTIYSTQNGAVLKDHSVSSSLSLSALPVYIPSENNTTQLRQ